MAGLASGELARGGPWRLDSRAGQGGLGGYSGRGDDCYRGNAGWSIVDLDGFAGAEAIRDTVVGSYRNRPGLALGGVR